MNVENAAEAAASRIAAAIGEPARARILYCLLDDRARSSTELAVVAGVSPATTSVHLSRLLTERLIKVAAQGKHRYYSLQGREVARLLEGLSVLAGSPRNKFVPGTPDYLRTARTCYDHMAGSLGVLLHDRLKALGWLSPRRNQSYDLTPSGSHALATLGVDVEATRTLRRRFAFACLDWSERRFHLGGAIGAAILTLTLNRKWVVKEIDSRALSVTNAGRREMLTRFGLKI